MIDAKWYLRLAKNEFPVKLRLEPQYKDGPAYGVEILGILDLSVPVLVFRTQCIQIEIVESWIRLLPVKEFADKFAKYRLETLRI